MDEQEKDYQEILPLYELVQEQRKAHSSGLRLRESWLDNENKLTAAQTAFRRKHGETFEDYERSIGY